MCTSFFFLIAILLSICIGIPLIKLLPSALFNILSKNTVTHSKKIIQIIRKKVINKENKILDLYASKIMKYNTRYRDIPSEVSKIKIAKGAESIKLMRILDRVVRKALVAIDNKTEFNIRDKDIKNLMSIEPSATITKFQTRD